MPTIETQMDFGVRKQTVTSCCRQLHS